MIGAVIDARPRAWLLAVLGTTAAYALAALAQYAATPLGHVPLLDVRETVDLARAIAAGDLPTEPFFRAPLYAALLAPVARGGVSDAALLDFARLLNLVAHVASAGLVFSIARQLWGSRLGAGIAALAFGLHPVAIHFAGDAQDTTVALALFLGGVRALLAQDASPQALRPAGAAGTLFALATLARPNYASVLLAWVAWTAWRGLRVPDARRAVAAGLLLAVLPLAAMATLNRLVGDEWRVLPWQGPYNFWKANGPDANGRYFANEVRIPFGGQHVNPARAEAELLYQRAHGIPAPSRGTLNRYWMQRTVGTIREAPGRWLGLLAAKLFYLVNDFEQYNTRTYHVHKARLPALAPNPLGFGWLATLAALALARHGGAARPQRIVLALAGCYTAGALLYFAGDRFRFPLSALAAVLGAGAFVSPSVALARWRTYVIAAALAFLVAVWWPLPAALRDETVETDLRLLAAAANAAGRYDEAYSLARAADARRSQPASKEAVCITGYNASFAVAARASPIRKEVESVRAACLASDESASASHLAAVLAWHLGDVDAAGAVWRAQSSRPDAVGAAARASLVAAGLSPPPPAGHGARSDVEMLFALAARGDAAACAALRRADWGHASPRLASTRTMYRIDTEACAD